MSQSPGVEISPLKSSPPIGPPKKRRPKSATKGKSGRKTTSSNKKRKTVDGDPIGTLASGAGRKPGARSGKMSHSATPMAGVSPESEDEEEEDDDDSVEDEDAVYCICRKPDNHTWMIGCDGGCDDWYHGKCVSMRQEDEQLIDKFICPVCVDSGDIVTTWKPMCRRDGCRNPARLKKGSESKYCSDTCGQRFWLDRVQEQMPSRKRLRKGSRHSVKAEELEDDADLGPLGGTITSAELKALVQAVPSAMAFRNMGDLAALTPPDSSSIDRHNGEQDQLVPVYEPYEQSRLDEIAARKTQLFQRRMTLRKRERFVKMTRDRATRLRQTTKDMCGYDPRLAQDERDFSAWSETRDGLATLEQDTLDDPLPKREDDDEADETTVCIRRRCKKHGEWQKIALQDVRFDEAEVGDEMRGIDAEETELRRAGIFRARERMGGGIESEGTVEAVDLDMQDV